MTLKTSTVTISPVEAADFLERNPNNRNISQPHVQDLASQMRRGLWRLNGESIIINWDGEIADGQHRLWACVEAGVPFETVFVRGVDPAVFATIDSGKKRSAADCISISGIRHNHHTLAAAATIIINYQRGTLLGKLTVPRQDVVDFVERNAELQEWVSDARKAKGWTTAYSSSLAAIMFLGARKHPIKAKEFLRKFCTGEDLHTGSPVLALRNRLGTDKHLPKAQRLSLIVQAWNAFVSDRSLMRMQLPRADEFPKIAGA